ncbi:MAG: ATP-binding protein [Phototrophicaceae bacterium]
MMLGRSPLQRRFMLTVTLLMALVVVTRLINYVSQQNAINQFTELAEVTLPSLLTLEEMESSRAVMTDRAKSAVLAVRFGVGDEAAAAEIELENAKAAYDDALARYTALDTANRLTVFQFETLGDAIYSASHGMIDAAIRGDAPEVIRQWQLLARHENNFMAVRQIAQARANQDFNVSSENAVFVGNQILLVTSLSLIFTLIIAIGIGVGFNRGIVMPIRNLTETVQQFGKGNLSARVVLTHRDEMGLLAAGFNQMAENLQTQLQEAEQLVKQATAANEFKKRLLARVSHELRTPIGATQGFAEMLRANVYGEVNAQQHEMLDLIIANALEQAHMVNELLAQSQADFTALRVDRSRFSPALLVEQLLEQLRPMIGTKPLQLIGDISLALPAEIESDKAKVELIVRNLVSNAIKFTPSGEVRVAVTHLNAPHALQIQVKDTGIGIPPEKQQLVFEAFRQVNEEHTREYGGIGLGLSLVRDFTELLGGTVTLQSTPKVGSTFTVQLPLS